MGDFVQDAVGAEANNGRQTVSSAIGGLGWESSEYTKLIAKMNRQAADPALMPHAARPQVLNTEVYGGAPGGIRVSMEPKPNAPEAGQTLANSKLLHPSKSWNDNFGDF